MKTLIKLISGIGEKVMKMTNLTGLIVLFAFCMNVHSAEESAIANLNADDALEYKVTYLMFSGRKNPSVVVSDPKEMQNLNRSIASFVSTGQKTAQVEDHAVLGYNGVLIEKIDLNQDSIPIAIVKGERVKLISRRGPIESRPSANAKLSPREDLASETSADLYTNNNESLEAELLDLGQRSGVLTADHLGKIR